MYNGKIESIRDKLFFLICLTIPFMFIPKVLNKIGFIGGPISTQLVLYPVLLFFLYTAFSMWKEQAASFFYWRRVEKFMLFYAGILLICAIHGILIFPYTDLIVNSNAVISGKLGGVTDFFQTHNISYDRNSFIKIWVSIRLIKNVMFQCLYTFLFSYLIFCWYKNSYNKALSIILRSIRIVSVGIVVYAGIEVFYYSGSAWACNILSTMNPMFYDIKSGMGWWPPLFWVPARLRAFFPEPSFLGMYIAFALPFLWSSYVDGKMKKIDIILIFLLEIICFLTYSKTSVMLSLGEGVLFFLLCGYSRNKKNIMKSFCLAIVFLCAFCASIFVCEQFENSSIQGESDSSSVVEYTKTYWRNNAKGVFDEKSGSNSSRLAVVRSELRIWEKYPLLGVGIAQRQCYISSFLTDEEKEIGELSNCIQYQQKLGVFSSGFPAPCEYSADLAELGIVGTFIKLFPFMLLIWKIIKYRRSILYSNDNLSFTTVAVALAGCLANGLSNHLTVIYTTWVLLGIAFAMLQTLQEKKHENY